MKRVCAVLLLFSCACLAAQSTQEQEVWKLEHAYWEYVKAFDLEHYRSLWNANFVGWPQASADPVRKDHITDWIAEHKIKGEELKSFSLEPAASQTFGDIVITHYWVTDVWGAKDQAGQPVKSRITHTWLRTKDGWQIIGGMSAPVKAANP